MFPNNNNNNNNSNDEYPGNNDSFIGNTNISNYSGNNNFPPNNNSFSRNNNNNNNNNNSFPGNNNNNSNFSGNNFSGNNNYSDNNYDDDDDNSYYGNSDGMQGPNNNSSFFSESENCDQQQQLNQQQQQQDDEEEEDTMNNSDSGNDNSSDMVIKLRGLPWSATIEDILTFFEGVRINGERDGIHLVSTTEGRSSGEAFVEVDDMDMPEAIKRDKKNIGHRYIEVFKVKRAEMEWVLERSNGGGNNHSNMNSFRNNNSDDNETYVRMRGLPFECSKEEIARFFNGLDVVNISIQYSNVGRATGECYVKFRNKEVTEKALLRDRNCIKHRYIEIFRVGASEMRNIEQSNARPMVNRNNRPPQFNRPGPYDRDRGNNQNGPNNRYGSNQQRQNRYFSKGNGFDEDTWNNYANEVGPASSWNYRGKKSGPPNRRNNNYNSNANVILMRGLPFKANENDIRKFFDPLVPMNIEIIYDSTGRPSGTAKVQFGSGDDMTRAMGKHKERIFTRYIELFVNAS